MRKKNSFSRNHQSQKPWLTDYLIPVGSLLIAALAFLMQYAQLPRWITVVAVGYLIIVAAVSAYIYIPVGRLVSLVAEKRSSRRVSKTYFPRVLESMGVLHQLLARGQADTLLYVLAEATQWDELRGRSSLIDPEHVEIMRSWLSSIEGRVERHKRDDFSGLCWEISELTTESSLNNGYES